MGVLLIFHNALIRLGVQPNYVEHINWLYYPQTVVGYFRFWGEPLAGPAWFLMPYFGAVFIWSVMNLWVIRGWGRHGILIAASLGCAFVGYKAGRANVNLDSYWDVALMIMPFVAIGDLARRYFNPRMFNKVLMAMAVVALLVAELRFGVFIELASRSYVNPVVFFFLAGCGIYVCGCLAAATLRLSVSNPIRRALEIMGKHSMDIMILHFVFFKMFDYCWLKFGLANEDFALSMFPHSMTSWYANCGYVFLGCICPVFVGKGADRFLGFLKKRKEQLV